MRSTREHYFDLDEDDRLYVYDQPDGVILRTLGHNTDGLCVVFKPCHLSELRTLILALEKLQADEETK